MQVHVQMQQINRLAMKDGQSLLQSTQAARVADVYHPHRMKARVNNATKAGSLSPFDAFHDDDLLREAIKLQQRYRQTVGTDYPAKLSVLSGVREVWTWRPGFAAYVYRKYGARGGVVLDPCMGYGSGLVGWLASGLGGSYVGVDPCRETYLGNTKLAEALAPKGSVFLLCEPFEDVKAADLRSRVDLVFTSPPYAFKQRYSDEPTQSAMRFPTFEAWRAGFLMPLLKGASTVLKKGGACVINVADVKIGKRAYPLEGTTVEAAHDAGLVLTESLRYTLGRHFGETGQPWARLEDARTARSARDPDAVRSEAVLVFKKT